MKKTKRIAIIGAGFAGLACAYKLSKSGHKVLLFEKEKYLGGLAGSFKVGKSYIEKFYHHWFNGDKEIVNFIHELNLIDQLEYVKSKTGMFYFNKIYRLSSPLDLLKFKPLNFIERIKLGLFVLKVRRIKDWKNIVDLSCDEWMIKMLGKKIYNIVWKPLLDGKFGNYSKDISAVYLWNKIILRGSSRNKKGDEELLYFKGGFIKLIERIEKEILRYNGKIFVDTPVINLSINKDNKISEIKTMNNNYFVDEVVSTTSLPITIDLIKKHVSNDYINKLNQVKYLGNICLILELKKPLSDRYWININDSSFPFVGIIEHTNFISKKNYRNNPLAYISKYIPVNDSLYKLSDEEYLNYCIPYIQRVFPDFTKEDILEYFIWRAEYAQPIITKGYDKLIPDIKSEIDNLFLCTMAQIFPEDRGTNYAIKKGFEMAKILDE